MNFAATEEIDAPIADVFELLSDVERFERAVTERGAQLRRTSGADVTGRGMSWDLAFDLSGHRREMDLELVGFEAPNRIALAATSSSLDCDIVLDLAALSAERTGVSARVDLHPKTLSARLLVQSLKLAQASLTKQFAHRVGAYAKEIETRCQAGRGNA